MTARPLRLAVAAHDDAERRGDRLAKLRDQAVYTPSEYALLAGKSKSWVCDALARGVLPGFRDGSRWLLRRAELQAAGWL